jgi:uncharacterized protein YukE
VDGTTIAAVLTALGAFIGAVVLAYRGLSGDRFARKVSESAALLTGYTEMVKNLRTEIDQMRQSHAADMGRMLKNHVLEINSINENCDKDRARWDRERLRLEERIETLEAQVYAVLHRPPGAQDRQGDQR